MAGEKGQRGSRASNRTRSEPHRGTIVPWVPTTPLPAFVNVGGRAVALVDAGEYRALLSMRDALARGEATVGAPGVVEPGPAGAHIPMRLTVLGINVVAMPATGPQQPSVPLGSSMPQRQGRLMRIDKDAEVQQFFLDRLGSEDLEHIRHAAIEQFGAARVPSRSAMHRFVVRMRAEQTAVQEGFNGR